MVQVLWEWFRILSTSKGSLDILSNKSSLGHDSDEPGRERRPDEDQPGLQMGHDDEPGKEGEQHADDAQSAADTVAAPHRLDRRDDRVVHEPDDDQESDDRRVLDILLRFVDESVEQNPARAKTKSAEKTEGEHRDDRPYRLVTFPTSRYSHPQKGIAVLLLEGLEMIHLVR
jgi:hypothetical protein